MAVTDQFTKQPTTMSNVNKPVDNRMPIQKEFAAINNAVNSVGDTIQSGVDYTMDNMVVPAVTSTYQGTVGKVVDNVQTGISEAKAIENDRAEKQIEGTLGGNNYYFGDNNQQGQLNSMVGSGAMAGINENLNSLRFNQLGKTATATPTRGNIAGATHSSAGTEVVNPQEQENIDTVIGNSSPSQYTNVPTVSSKTAGATQQGTQLKNADVNLSQYGDDSSAENYNNPELRGGQNAKYEGENTKNSQIGYDANARLDTLDPNYKFGWDAQLANSESAGYIARRNDQIASALYNEGLTSITDVAEFLNKMPGFQNSNANERANTINSIWKRLGSIASQNQQNVGGNGQSTNNADLSQMQSDLSSKGGTIYGKVGADADGTVNTIADANSIYNTMAEGRMNNVKALQGMDSESIAASIISGYTPGGDQAMRDLMQYDPAKYAEVQTALKEIRGQTNINNISSGKYEYSSSIGSNNVSTDIDNFASNNANSTTSVSDILKSVNSTLESNDAADSASKTMAQIENDMSKLQNRLKNLKSEAKKAFKGDVPQYVVNAYISNRTAEIQNEMSMLEQRYNAAYSRYQNEWEKTKWEAEFGLKKQELQLKQESQAWSQYMDTQGLDLSTTTNSNLMRTERNNNPTAMTTDVAKTLGLVEGVDYIKGDPFQSGSGTLYTARFLGDPIETTIKALDTAVANGRGAFYTQSGGKRWTHTAMTNAERSALSNEGKREVVLNMLKREGGNINNMTYYTGNTVSPTDIIQRKDGKTFNPTIEYASLNDADRLTVKGLLDLTVDPSTLTTRFGYKEGQAQKLINAAASINPDWTSNDYKNMKDVVKNRTDLETKGANDKNATAMTIAKELYDSLDNLGNKKLQGWNEVVNYVKNQLSDTDYAKFRVHLNTFISETASAMKGGNAAATDQDKQDFKDMFSTSMGKEALKEMVITMANNLYGKNETQAKYYGETTLTKPNPIWTDEVTQWMYDTVGTRTLSKYYNYSPSLGDLDIFVNGGGSATAVYTAQDILSA